jgi:acyl-CoA reductase-like NAD-dependent aldehyde dehydrogenase
MLCILTYRNEDEAAAIASDTDYGLTSHAFPSDPIRPMLGRSPRDCRPAVW